ncbi:MAG: 50S ribosomal protein L13 [Gemmatimonadales bacterium]|nr:50S ribosomal protein L13 [Gemmatimonadales bacterium]
METFSVTPKDIEHQWFVVDATNVPLGRLASRVAQVIRGKHKPTFSPHLDTGDSVIVVNAAKVRLTGRKADQKGYFSHSGYMGHDKITPIRNVRPERVVQRAVFGMLPKSSLSRQVLRLKLRVYAGADHPHVAQQPAPLTVFAPKSKRKA